MNIRPFLPMVAALLLVTTQTSCTALPGSQPTPTPLTLPHELLQAEEGDLAVTLTLVEGDNGKEYIAWTVDSTGEGPGYEIALHQATLPHDARVESWAEAEKASPNKSTAGWKSPGRTLGRQSAGKTMLYEVQPGERVALFLEMKVELAEANGVSGEIGTIRGPVLLERVGAAWALVPTA